ncbi:hypothetical protein ACGFJC_52455 [Nonomuraea fuscirosea]|uniref:hypothetical protein n=1 Tax=Nonomuraea fuscirosea TaxID=1291556 RepID=UPI0034956918
MMAAGARELAAQPDGGYAAGSLADRLTERGRIDEGIAILLDTPGKWLSNVVRDLARLLAQSS